MEVILRKERSEYVEHEDGIGQEYVDLMRVKEELEENRLEDLGKGESARPPVSEDDAAYVSLF